MVAVLFVCIHQHFIIEVWISEAPAVEQNVCVRAHDWATLKSVYTVLPCAYVHLSACYCQWELYHHLTHYLPETPPVSYYSKALFPLSVPMTADMSLLNSTGNIEA